MCFHKYVQHYFPLMLFTIFAHNAPEGFKEEIACKMGGLLLHMEAPFTAH